MNNLLNTFEVVSKNYYNSNSLHKLGVDAKRLESASIKEILTLFNLNDKEVIYTSGRCESNNLCILGYLEKYKGKYKKIITTKEEDSSIIESLKSLEEYTFIIDFIDVKDNIIDVDQLKEKADKDTVLICLSNYNNIEEVFSLVKPVLVDNRFNHIYNYNLASFLTFELDNFKGIGCLIKNKKIVLMPLLHGGNSCH